MRAGLSSLREERAFAAVREAIWTASGASFRVWHFSVQADHLHVLVEADGSDALTRGLQGLAIRVAKAVNRKLGRHGRFWDQRHHVRTLRTPREVRNALVYVLNNWRKHMPGARGVDARSSARWFDGWRTAVARPAGWPPVVSPTTWLARVGWRRHGLLGVGEEPRRGSSG